MADTLERTKQTAADAMDRAKHEASRLADEMRKGADSVRKGIDEQLKTHPIPQQYDYARLTQQLRLAQLVALPAQAIALYLGQNSLGPFSFLLPIAVIALAIYLVFTRWQQQADARKDVQRMMNNENVQVKARHAAYAAGPFLLALLVSMISPKLDSSIYSMIFSLANYASLAISLAGMVLTLFETYNHPKSKAT